VGVTKFLPSYAGFLFLEEILNLSKAFNPPKPFVFLLAGAKFETKFPLVKKFLKLADSVFIGGALANDLFKAEGYEIGLSKHSKQDFGFSEIAGNPKLLLPSDVVVENSGKNATKGAKEVSAGDSVLDDGPKTVLAIEEKISTAKFILWNGTLGAYEEGYKEGTVALAKAIVASGAESIVGGGDTIASIYSLNLLDKFSFVSTGGGAMLDFLANETLPGITALEANVRSRS
jgi:phosphoglycerate kinase